MAQLSVPQLRAILADHDKVVSKRGNLPDLLIQAAQLDLITRAQFDATKATRASCKTLEWPSKSMLPPEVDTNPFSRLPELLVRQILSYVDSDTVPPRERFVTMFGLQACDRWFRDAVRAIVFEPAKVTWKKVVQTRPAVARDSQKNCKGIRRHPYVLNVLAGKLGCMVCNDPLVRKVYWEYNVRCCQYCLFQNTIAGHYLEHDYEFGPNEMRALQKRTVELYRTGYNSFNCDFYWRPDAIMLVRQRYGVDSLAEFKQMKIDKREADARRREELGHTLIEQCIRRGIGYLNLVIMESPTYKRILTELVEPTDADYETIKEELVPLITDYEAERAEKQAFTQACRQAGIQRLTEARKLSPTYRQAHKDSDYSATTIQTILQEIRAAAHSASRTCR
jgi:hypothetical protein